MKNDSNARPPIAAFLLLCRLCLLCCAGLAAGCATDRTAPRGGNGMSRIMATKLRHAQSVLTAVVQADYPAAERNALALQSISAGAMSLPQDTVSYAVLADQFREVAGTLAREASEEDLDGVTAAYLELTRTCVACHTQVHRERLLSDFPDKVSRRPAALNALVETGS